MSAEQVREEVARGGRFVIFQYCFSVLIMTLRRNTEIYFVRPGESAASKGMQWTLLTLLVGWWGFPWGLIFTPMVLFKNLSGGKDVTGEMMAYLAQAAAPSTETPQAPPPNIWPPPPTFLPPQ